MIRLVVFAVFIHNLIAQQDAGNADECSGPTTINYIYSDNNMGFGEPHFAKGSVLQGRPGRRGGPGPKGEKVW